jgi:hypothetical protein
MGLAPGKPGLSNCAQSVIERDLDLAPTRPADSYMTVGQAPMRNILLGLANPEI